MSLQEKQRNNKHKISLFLCMKTTELHCILHLRIFLFGDGLRKFCLLAFHSLSFKPHNSSKQHFGVKMYNVYISNCNAEGGFVFEMFFGRNIMWCLCLERELVLGLCHHLCYFTRMAALIVL